MSISEYVPVSQVWARHESPLSLGEVTPAVRVMASVDHPGDFIFQIRAMGEVVSVRLDDDVLAELHRQAMAARRTT